MKPETDNLQLLVTVKAAGAALCIGQTKTWELIKTGHLETRRIGTRRLVTVDSVKRLAETGA